MRGEVRGEKPKLAPPTDLERFHDIIDGERIAKNLMVSDIFIANRLLRALSDDPRERRTRQVFIGVSFDLGLGDGKQRMPEIAYVSTDRWPLNKPLPSDDPWRVVPDLVADIVRPDQDRRDAIERIEEYRRAGVRLTWTIDPGVRRVIVNAGRLDVRQLHLGDHLDGRDVAPWFSMPLAELFRETFM